MKTPTAKTLSGAKGSSPNAVFDQKYFLPSSGISPSRENDLTETMAHLEKEIEDERQKNVDLLDMVRSFKKENASLKNDLHGLENECIKV